MKGEGYPYISDFSKEEFFFDSIGEKGVIQKKVEFAQTAINTWNMAFGDKTEDDNFRDKVISNNHDARKVIQTVVNALYDFTEKYPDRVVYIEPVDEKRKWFYNTIISRKWKEIEPNFKVTGLINGIKIAYRPDYDFDAFYVQRKK